ncbi:MAG: SUMF1/EgtB/PvdO family nonheme iron enzyme [Deltaproteobacteria bacterium]|nr:SUMF1/EgtB/PvdO family nonheme iron enzyme [Deltaproteobacteria bacterium]
MSLARHLAVVADVAASLEDRIASAHALAEEGDPRLAEARPIPIPAGILRRKISNDSPIVEIAVPAFAIARYPVTVGEFARFIADEGYDDPSYWSAEGWSFRLDEGLERPRFWGEAEWAPYLVSNHPVVGVSAFEAEAYASYCGARLPRDHEWERAARGDDARDYPWGDAWDPAACCSREHGPRSTIPVGVHPRGMSPFGVHDLCGAVWQWTEDARASEGTYGPPREVRGGAWNNLPWSIGCSGRNAYPPEARFSNLGFRLVFDRP